ncbi:MAG: trypsin-like peptidase domain-containing protein [Proteobacteria bacterium]|nr:trypsin-like peptidase domain-containing protein [Pseudomonadota bacterium]
MPSGLSRGLFFLASSVVAGLALAFVIIAVRPQLLRPAIQAAAPEVAQAPAAPAAPALPAAQTLAAPTTAVPPPSVPTAGPTPGIAAQAALAVHGSLSSAAARAAPAVVNIYTARVVTERLRPTLGELFGDYLPRYRQRIERSLGSGVIVDEAGHIVTNHHVIANADSVRVQLADGRVANARIVGRDPDTDLAVLQIDIRPLPVAVFGRSDQLRVGDLVLAIGNPLGLSQTVTHGIVSATSRQQLGIAPLEDFIQTDAPINFGNSGGALVDASGALVGINTAIVAKNLGVEGIGFAIPVNMVRGVLREIVAHGHVMRGWIGILPEDLNDEQAGQLGLAQAGVVIGNLYAGSPAQQAGLQPGDLLLAINAVPPRNAQDALGRIATLKPGATVLLRGLRGRQVFETRATVRERPRGAGG